MQFRVACLEYNLLCVWIGSGDLLDDVERHGCHDFFDVIHSKGNFLESSTSHPTN